MDNAQTRPELLKTVRGVVEAMVGQRAVVADDDALYSSGLLDSMSIVDLLVALEGKFKVKIPGGEIQPDDLDSITKISTTVARYVKVPGLAPR